MLTNVVEQRSSLANHSKQTASARIVSHCTTHVLGHSIDSLRQHGNLHIWRTIVTLMCAKLADYFLFSFFCNGHVKRNSHLLATTTSGIPGGLDFYYWRTNVTPFFKNCNGNSPLPRVRMKRSSGPSRQVAFKNCYFVVLPPIAVFSKLLRLLAKLGQTCLSLTLFESPSGH